MSLSSTLRRAAAPAALAVAAMFGMAANSNAAEQCLPGVYDAQRGIKEADCYTTPEINKAMAAFAQKTRIVADRIAVGDNANGEVVFPLFHNRWTSSDDGKIGFNLESNAPTGKPATEWRVGAVIKDVVIWDRNKPSSPTTDMVGQSLAKGIEKSGDRLLLSGKSGQVYYAVVAGKNDPSTGSFLAANNQKGAGLAVLKGIDYAPAGKALIEQRHQASTGDITATLALNH